MRHRFLAVVIGGVAVAMPLVLGMADSPTAVARADAIAYLLNVTMRPGYNVANADHALAYGHGVCDKIAGGMSYAQLTAEVKADFAAADDYQASCLTSQPPQELCPQLIWRLRNSAAGYVTPAP